MYANLLSEILSSERSFHEVLSFFWLMCAPVVFCMCMVLKAPYGRFGPTNSKKTNPLFGFRIHGKWGWFVQEVISPIVFLISFFGNSRTPGEQRTPASWVFLALWIAHYINRSIIYTLRMPTMSDTTFLVVLSAVFFNLINGYVNGRAVGVYGVSSDFSNPRVVLGIALWFLGLAINNHSDHIVITLKRKKIATGSKGYFIPHGGMFDFVSAPNYLGEMIEWFGWALATHTVAGFAFFALTFANLFPRALDNHKWYRRTFKESYPKNRTAVIPFLI